MLPNWLTNPNPEIYLGDNYLVLDFETTNADKGSPRNRANRLLYARASNIHNRVYSYSKFGNEYEHAGLLRLISQVDFIVAHNAKFELQWLERCGLNLNEVLVYDTLLGEYVLAGNRRWPLDLDSTLKRYNLGGKDEYVSRLIKGGVCPSEIPGYLLKKYGDQDVSETEKLFLAQRQKLNSAGLLPTQFTRCVFTPVLADIELRGMALDSDVVDTLYHEHQLELAQVQKELDEITGGINMQSTNQVAEFIYGELGFSELKDKKGNPIRGKPNKRFPGGLPKTDVATIAALRATNNRQKKFLALKQRQSKLSKAINTYLTPFKEVCDEKDGILYGNFNQAVTQTHRLSSSKPNFQNFDRRFKRCFTHRSPREDTRGSNPTDCEAVQSSSEEWRIGERDYAQLEFRVAAFLGQDKQAIQDIEQGTDVHSVTAGIIGVSRQEAKSRTFKPLYGGTTGTRKEQEYYEYFKQHYNGVATTQQGWSYEVLKKKELTTVTGLKFYWPDTTMTGTGYITNTSSIYNYPVQSLATAEIVPIAVTYMWYRMQDAELRSFIINTVHDSVITEEIAEEEDAIKEIAERAFIDDVLSYLDKVYNIDFNVPLAIEHKIGTHWG